MLEFLEDFHRLGEGGGQALALPAREKEIILQSWSIWTPRDKSLPLHLLSWGIVKALDITTLLLFMLLL